MGTRSNKKVSKKKQNSITGNKVDSTKISSGWKIKWSVLLAILTLAFLCYSPNLNNDFVNWDDSENIYDNDLITDLNNENFWDLSAEIFKTDIIGGYNPLTNWTFLVEHKIFGIDNPEYWHFNNILLHLISCSFVFWIGFRMKLGLFGTSLLTVLFAIHPMRVESVAWVTERKDVLFGAFYLASVFYYIKGKQEGFRTQHYIIIGICFILSLFSKIQAVILPVSLVLIDYYFSEDAKLKVSHVLKKWPLFLLSLGFGLLGVFLLADEGSTDLSYSGSSRLFIGSYSLAIYYIKSLIPYRLSPLYAYPASLNWIFYLSIVSFIMTAYALWFSYTKKHKHIFWGLAFFVVNIIMLLQILGAGHGFLADRFTYIPYLGLFFIYAWYLEKLIKQKQRFKVPIYLFTFAICTFYSVMCFTQNTIWKNSETLWTHVLKYYPTADTPWANRAQYYRDNGKVKEALFDFSQYIKLQPEEPEAYNSKARLYFNFQEKDSLIKALDNFSKAIELNANNSEYLVNRGSTYAKLNQKEKAILDFDQAEKIDPDYPNIYFNRFQLYNSMENWEKALQDIDSYLKLNPHNAKLWLEKARLHMILKQFEEWLNASDNAISREPKNGLIYYERGRGFHYFNKAIEARTAMQEALDLGYKRGNKDLIEKILNSK